MEKYNWYFRQKVNPTEMTDAMDATDDAIKQLLLDTLYYGLITVPSVSERNTTPNMSVDVNPPLKAYDENGEWVYLAPGSPINISLADVDLPAPGNQKYVSVVARFARAESDPRIDGNGNPVNYRLAQSYELDLVEGTEAATGSAVRPSMPPGDLRVANVLLSSTTTEITNSLIDQLYIRRAGLGNMDGVAGNEFEINREKSGGDPGGADVYLLTFNRGERTPYRIRVLEGADPTTDPPRIQFSVFTDSDTFSWTDVLTSGNTTDADILLSNQSYAGKLVGFETQEEVNDWLDGDNLTDEMVNIAGTYSGNLDGMLTQDEVNAFVDAAVFGGGNLFAADLTALALIDDSGFVTASAVVSGLSIYRWISGQLLPVDGYSVINGPNGQWVLATGQTLSFSSKQSTGGQWDHDLNVLAGKIAKLSVDARAVNGGDTLVKVDGVTIDTITPGGNEWYLVEPASSVSVQAQSNGFDLNLAAFDSGQSYNASAQVLGAAESVVLSPDKSNLYILDQNGANTAIHQYSLSTPGDINTGVSHVASLTIGGTYPNATGLHLKSDGTRIYVGNNSTSATTRSVAQFNMASPFAISSASAAGQTVLGGLVAWSGSLTDICLSEDGEKLLACDSGSGTDTIKQFSLSSAHDVSTGVTYDSVALNVTTHAANVSGVFWGPDKTKLFVVGQTDDNVAMYATTGGTVNAASYTAPKFAVSAQTGLPRGLWFDPQGTKFYTASGSTGRTVYRYTGGTGFDGDVYSFLEYTL